MHISLLKLKPYTESKYNTEYLRVGPILEELDSKSPAGNARSKEGSWEFCLSSKACCLPDDHQA